MSQIKWKGRALFLPRMGARIAATQNYQRTNLVRRPDLVKPWMSQRRASEISYIDMPVTAMAEVKDGLDQCFTCSLYGHAFANCPIKGTKPREAFNDWRLVDNGKMYSVLALWPHLALEHARSGSPIYEDASSDSVVNLNDKDEECVKGNAQTLGAEMSKSVIPDAPEESLNVTVVQETCPDTTKPIGNNGLPKEPIGVQRSSSVSDNRSTTNLIKRKSHDVEGDSNNNTNRQVIKRRRVPRSRSCSSLRIKPRLCVTFVRPTGDDEHML